MVVSFQNSFFSLAGQAERLSNAGQTILAAVTGKGVTSNTGVKPLDTALSVAASNPFITAGVAAVAVAPTAALGAAKAAATSLSSAFKAAPLATKAKVTLGAALVAPLIIAKPKESLQAVSKAPSSIINFEKNLVDLYKNPSLETAKTTFKENPVISGALAAGVAAAVGIGLGSAVAISTNIANVKATKENTKLMSQGLSTAQKSILGLQDGTLTNDIAAAAPISVTKEEAGQNSLTSKNSPLVKEKAAPVSSKKAGSRRKTRRKKHKLFKGISAGDSYGNINNRSSKCYNFY